LRKDAVALASLVGLAGIYFVPILLGGNDRVLSSIDGDTWSQFFYWRRFAYDSLARWELPLWNPYSFSGTPFVGAMQSAIFYPPNLLFLFFDTAFAINLSVAIHCLGTSVFTYLFARNLDITPFGAALAGITFAYSAPYFLHIYPGHLPHLGAMWMPLMFLGMELFLRDKKIRHAIWAGVYLAVQLLAGYPQYSFYSALAVSLYFFLSLILRKDKDGWLRLIAGYVFFVTTALGLAAVQLLPAWEMVIHSARAAVSYQWVSLFSLPPENLLTMILPNIYGDMVQVPYWGKNNLWEMSIYLGVVPLALIVVALVSVRRREFVVFAVLAGLFLLLALGKHTPLLWLLYTFVPGFDLFRGVAKASFVYAFAGAVVAGMGTDQLHEWMAKRDKKLLRFALWLVIVPASVFIVALAGPAGEGDGWRSVVRSYAASAEHFAPLPLSEPFFRASLEILWDDMVKLSLVIVLLATLCVMGVARRLRAPNVILMALLALTTADLWHFGARFLVTFDPKILTLDRELKAFFLSDREPFRIATPLGGLRNHLLNVGMIEGLENVGGYDAIVVKRYSEFINFTQGLPITQPNLLMGINRISPLLNILNVKYYVVEPAIELNLPEFELVFANANHKVFRSRNVLPRSFVVHEARIAMNEAGVLRHLVEPAFDPLQTAIVEKAVRGMSHSRQHRSPAPVVLEHTPQKFVVEAEAVAPALLVLADTSYPGWKAFVGGKETQIHRANYVMRAVFLPPGRHRVEFRYEPNSFQWGVSVSLVTLFLLAVAFAVSGTRLRRKN